MYKIYYNETMGNLDYKEILFKIENTRRFGNEPGVTVTSQVIKKLKEVIVFEAEKSVLKYGSCFTQNKSVAVGGSSFSQYHGIILKDAGVTKIVLAFDNDYSEDGDRYYGLKKMIKEAKKIQDMGFEVEIIYDWEQEYLGNKDAPIDLGRSVYSKLYRERKKLAEVIELYEEDTNEVPTTE